MQEWHLWVFLGVLVGGILGGDLALYVVWRKWRSKTRTARTGEE